MDSKQFRGMSVPKDIKPFPELTKEQILDYVNTARKNNNLPELNNNLLCLNFNSRAFRQNEINIVTTDSLNYKADYDFCFYDESDSWRRICKIKACMNMFKNIDVVRCDNFLYRLNACDVYTFFEDAYNMLRLDGLLIITYLDIFKWTKHISENTAITKLEKLESMLFANSDSSGLNNSQTIWDEKRLNYYLKQANFKKVEIDQKYSDEFYTCLKAIKE